MKQTIRDECFTRLKKIIKTSLNSKNSIDAINTFSTSATTYRFIHSRTWLVDNGSWVHWQRNKEYPEEVLYFEQRQRCDGTLPPTKRRGRGLINITDQYKNHIVMYSCYLRNTEEQHLLLVSASQAPLRSKSLHEKANKYSEEINEDTDELATKTKIQMKNQLKKKRIE